MNRRLAVEGEALITADVYQGPWNRACYDVPKRVLFRQRNDRRPDYPAGGPRKRCWPARTPGCRRASGSTFSTARGMTAAADDPVQAAPRNARLAKAGGIVPLCAGILRRSRTGGAGATVFPGRTALSPSGRTTGRATVLRRKRWVADAVRAGLGAAAVHVGAAQGNLPRCPAKRRYTVVFRSVRPCEVVLEGADGSQIETDYDAAPPAACACGFPLADVRMPVSPSRSRQGLSMAENPLVDQVSGVLYPGPNLLRAENAGVQRRGSVGSAAAALRRHGALPAAYAGADRADDRAVRSGGARRLTGTAVTAWVPPAGRTGPAKHGYLLELTC